MRDNEFWEMRQAEADDANTTAARLHTLISEANDETHKQGFRNEEMPSEARRLRDAVACHPNAPPVLLMSLVEQHARAFCENPIAPFIIWEQPDFTDNLGFAEQLALLQQETDPLHLVQKRASGHEGDAYLDGLVRDAARQHILFAGELGADDWEHALCGYWKADCADAEEVQRQWNIEVAEAGFVPSWAKGPEPVPEPTLPPVANQHMVDNWFNRTTAPGSDEEMALLRQLGHRRRMNLRILARGLRKQASPADLRAILDVPGYRHDLIHATVLQHPAADASVVAKAAPINLPCFIPLAVRHEKTSADTLALLLQSHDPNVRRLVLRHSNAPPNAAELSLRVALMTGREGRDAAQLYPGGKRRPAAFADFVGHFAVTGDGAFIAQNGADFRSWKRRLLTVFDISPERWDAPLAGDSQNRTARELLSEMASDGNRFVRVAAREKLADPDYVWTW